MKKIKLGIISAIFLFLITFFYLIINDRCKSLSIFSTTLDFGIGHIQTCFFLSNIKENIKEKLVNFPILYDVTVKFYKKYYLNPKRTQEEKKTVSKFKFDSINQNLLEIPFIKGIINSKELKKNEYISSDDNYEYNYWYRSHGGNWNTKFDSQKKINKENINKLKLVWKYSSINQENLQKKWKLNVELNPVFINNKIIVVTADWKIVALDAETGNLIWKLQSDFMPSRRGMVVENDKKSNLENLFMPIGNVVYKINAKNGKVVKKFGKNGFIKAFTLVAPIIYKNKIIIVGKHRIFIFNKNTGEFIDKIEIHPKGINYGGIVWGGAALDKTKGIVYVNTGNPKPPLRGVTRPGNNKRSNSVVAIDLNMRKIIWDFQEVSHDLWDFDIPSPPIIHNLVIDDKIYEVVISVTKTGNTIILDRNNGKPIFDITYKKAPKSKNYEEITAPFQIYMKKPERFSKIEYVIEDIDKLPKESRNEIINILEKSNYGWFETPSFEKNLITFGLHGGALWSGATIDPVNQHLFIPVNNIPWILKNLIVSNETYTSFPDKLNDHHRVYINKCSSCHGKKRNGLRNKRGEKLVKHIPSLVGFYLTQNKSGNFDSLKKINDKHKKLGLSPEELEKLKKLFKWWDAKLQKNDEIGFGRLWHVFETKDGLPASNPPWGYIAKLDLVNGKILFKSPVGYKKINGKREKIGTANYGGVALNGAGILFFTGTEDSMAYAIDANNGEELWSYKMKAAGSAPPIIFNLNGKQYVSFVSSGGIFHNFKEKDSTIYTFTILDF